VDASDPHSQDQQPESGVRYGVIGCGGAIVGALILLLFISYVVNAFEKPSLASVGAAERWAYFIANLVVACYCFPAFKATRERAFLYLAFAALAFTYSALFTLVFGSSLPSPSSRPQLLFYYGLRHFVGTAGLVLYAWGVVLLARRAQGKRRKEV
jgi:hypothetical protein